MSEKRSSTVYDDVHRSMEARCSHWLIPLTNEIFKEHYTGMEEVILGRNERLGKKLTKEIKKRVTDSYFTIRADETTECYHLENQSTPKKMRVRAKIPSGWAVYDVQVIKIEDYTIDEIFEKQLFFLIPYHIFVYENLFLMYNKNVEEFSKLQKIYEDIIDRMERLVKEHVIEEHEYQFIIEMSLRVVEKVAEKYEYILKGLGDMMGGKVLESRVFQVYDEGVAQGALDMCIRFIKQGTVTLAEAAAQLGMTEEEIKARM